MHFLLFSPVLLVSTLRFMTAYVTPSLDQETKPVPPEASILTTMDERLAALEQLIIQRFDDLGRELVTLVQQLISQGSQVQAKLETRPTTLTAPAPSIRSTQKARKPAKKTTRGRRLPKTLVPLAAFRNDHSVSDKAVEYALEKGKITVERGKWIHNKRNVTIALSLQGQREFYDLFHEREGFQRCANCPHAL